MEPQEAPFEGPGLTGFRERAFFRVPGGAPGQLDLVSVAVAFGRAAQRVDPDAVESLLARDETCDQVLLVPSLGCQGHFLELAPPAGPEGGARRCDLVRCGMNEPGPARSLLPTRPRPDGRADRSPSYLPSATVFRSARRVFLLEAIEMDIDGLAVLLATTHAWLREQGTTRIPADRAAASDAPRPGNRRSGKAAGVG